MLRELDEGAASAVDHGGAGDGGEGLDGPLADELGQLVDRDFSRPVRW